MKVEGKTSLNVKVEAFSSAKDVFIIPDLVILAVKSYDTEDAIQSVKPIIGDNTYVMSLQNGLDNVEKIQKIVKKDRIIVCITTHRYVVGIGDSEDIGAMHKWTALYISTYFKYWRYDAVHMWFMCSNVAHMCKVLKAHHTCKLFKMSKI